MQSHIQTKKQDNRMNSREWGGGWRQKGHGWTKFEKCHIGESNIGGLHKKGVRNPLPTMLFLPSRNCNILTRSKLKK